MYIIKSIILLSVISQICVAMEKENCAKNTKFTDLIIGLYHIVSPQRIEGKYFRHNNVMISHSDHYRQYHIEIQTSENEIANLDNKTNGQELVKFKILSEIFRQRKLGMKHYQLDDHTICEISHPNASNLEKLQIDCACQIDTEETHHKNMLELFEALKLIKR